MKSENTTIPDADSQTKTNSPGWHITTNVLEAFARNRFRNCRTLFSDVVLNSISIPSICLHHWKHKSLFVLTLSATHTDTDYQRKTLLVAVGGPAFTELVFRSACLVAKFSTFVFSYRDCFPMIPLDCSHDLLCFLSDSFFNILMSLCFHVC